jgi:hypothetical protein
VLIALVDDVKFKEELFVLLVDDVVSEGLLFVELVNDAEAPALVPVVFEDVPFVLPSDVVPDVLAPSPAEFEGRLYV